MKRSVFLPLAGVLGAAVVLMSPGAMAQQRVADQPVPITAPVMAGKVPDPASDLAGPYLAVRQALRADDYAAGQPYFARAVAADPNNGMVLDWAVTGLLASGSFDAALAQADLLRAVDPQNPIGRLVRLSGQLRAGDIEALTAELDLGPVVGPLPDRLVRGWVDMARGDIGAGLDRFRSVARMPGLGAVGDYNVALALAISDDLQGALQALSASDPGPSQSRRALLLQIDLLARLGRAPEALALLSQRFNLVSEPGLGPLVARLRAGAPQVYDIARTPTQGLGEVFYLLALALREDAPPRQSLIYARLAEALNPDNDDALLLAGELLEDLDQTVLAGRAYAAVPNATPGFFEARLGLARTLRDQDNLEAALAELRALGAANPDVPAAHIALGDMLRREDRFAEAAQSYTRALDLIGAPDARHWSLFYSRGIAFERAQDWARAEPDLRRALALNPDQPFVLNYLGYSFLEMGTNLDEAMALIERAATQEPDNGYIIDSLAWGLFLLGRFEDAVDPMERAVTLMPVDPIVTDHLGDVYWAVGRVREARFQWHRALSFDPQDDLANRIRRKLAVGLDAVLIEEGAQALDARRQ